MRSWGLCAAGYGFHAIKKFLLLTNQSIQSTSLITIFAIIILKPIAMAVTLSSGGDGGVFAPSLFIGVFLGFLLAYFLNNFFGSDVIFINFMIIGMAAVFSASIDAPFTALFLVCGMNNGYTLFFPILMVCLIAKYFSKLIFPFTVYSYNPIYYK